MDDELEDLIDEFFHCERAYSSNGALCYAQAYKIITQLQEELDRVRKVSIDNS